MNRRDFLLRERYGWACAWCGRQTADTQVHHLAHKGMGGRHGEAKKVSEADTNKVPLCLTCHNAAHGERVIDSNGFECGACDRECAYRMVRRPA